MLTPCDRLLTVFQQARYDPPLDLAAALAALPDAGTLPVPATTWTLIVLARYRRLRLRAGHRGTGRIVAFGLAPDDGETPIAMPGFARDLGREPDGPEASFRALHEGDEAVHRSAAELVDAGLVEGSGGPTRAVRLSDRTIETPPSFPQIAAPVAAHSPTSSSTPAPRDRRPGHPPRSTPAAPRGLRKPRGQLIGPATEAPSPGNGCTSDESGLEPRRKDRGPAALST